MWNILVLIGQWVFITFCVVGVVLIMMSYKFPKIEWIMQSFCERHKQIVCGIIIMITVLTMIGIAGIRFSY